MAVSRDSSSPFAYLNQQVDAAAAATGKAEAGDRLFQNNFGRVFPRVGVITDQTGQFNLVTSESDTKIEELIQKVERVAASLLQRQNIAQSNELGDQKMVLRDGTQILGKMNPLIAKNCEAVCQKLNGNLREKDAFLRFTDGELEAWIKDLHDTLMDGLLERPGEYRTSVVGVSKESNVVPLAIVERLGAMDEYAKIERQEISQEKANTGIFKDHFYFPPYPGDIQGEMQKFSQQFLGKIRDVHEKQSDAVAVAAWVHKEIGRIHAFNGDGHGRLARALMNFVLLFGDEQPVIFLDADAYNEACQKDDRAFATFIREHGTRV